jgi:hypothetical protein
MVEDTIHAMESPTASDHGGGDGDQGDDQIWPPHALSSPSSIGGVAPDAGLDLSDGREGEGSIAAFLGLALGLCWWQPLVTARREGGRGTTAVARVGTARVALERE